jgi:pentatricopeptide repeat protein
MFEHAQKVFDEMHDRKCARTVLSLNALLGAGLNSKKFDLVGEIFKELPKKLSIEPDLISYDMVIKAFCEMGSFDLAISMLDEMEKKGIEPDLITFKTLLHGLYGKCQFSDGGKIWDRMNVVLGDRSYNAKLLGLTLEKKTKEAVELVEEMKSKGVKPNLFSFNAVIKGFINEGNLEEAKLWYNKIGQSSLAPDRMIFNMLIPFFCEKGEVDLAFNLCKEILKRKFVVDVSLLQLVVDGLVKESKMEEANMLVELGKFNKYARYTPLFSNTMKV